MMSFPTNDSEGVLIDTRAGYNLIGCATSTISIGYDDSVIDVYFR